MRATNNRYYPWIIVLMSSLFIFYNYIIQVSPGVMTKELMKQFHMTATGLGQLAAIYFYSCLLVQLFLGPLYDKYSPKLLSTAALLLMSISAYGFSKAHSLELAYLFRLLMGAGAGFATVSYLKLTAMCFSKETYSIVAGLLATAASIGAILGQTPLAYSVTHVGWNNTLALVAILGLMVSALFWTCIKSDKNQLIQTKTIPNNSICKTFIQLISQKKNFFANAL